MIALKLIAVAAGVAVLVLFSEDFGSELILAIVTCLS